MVETVKMDTDGTILVNNGKPKDSDEYQQWSVSEHDWNMLLAFADKTKKDFNTSTAEASGSVNSYSRQLAKNQLSWTPCPVKYDV